MKLLLASDPHGLKCALAAAVAGVACPVELVDPSDHEALASSSLPALSPLLVLPALEIDRRAQPVVGANSIARYLIAKQRPMQHMLGGPSLEGLMMVESLMEWEQRVLSPDALPLLAAESQVSYTETVNPEVVADSLRKTLHNLEYLEERFLRGGRLSLGEGNPQEGAGAEGIFTLADLCIWCALYPLLDGDSTLPSSIRDSFPRLLGFYQHWLGACKGVMKAVHTAGLHSMSTLYDTCFASLPSHQKCRRKFELSPVPDKPFYVTTPIYYVNADPHIGHMYTTLLADVFSRWARIRGFPTKFLTGTDEHGQKIMRSAEAQGVDPQEFCDRVSARFRVLFDDMNMSYDDYVRTTEERHILAAQEVWRRIEQAGFIFKGAYEGWYCVSDEAFVTDLQVEDTVDKDGHPIKVSKESGHPVEWVREENYMFKLSAFQDRLIEWLQTNPTSVQPEFRRQEVITMCKSGLMDLSISRTAKSTSWGIPVPGDDSHVMYVWIDALTNYLTGAGFPTDQETFSSLWPADMHIIGKDILRFHAVYWPAFLMAAGLELPRSIVAHGWWMKDGQKISKSLGNALEPRDVVSNFSLDAFRYFLCRESNILSDGNYSDVLMVAHNNADLADDLGNLFCRCNSRKLNRDLRVPAAGTITAEDQEVIDRVKELPAMMDSMLFRARNIQQGLIGVSSVVADVNRYVTHSAPWKLARSEGQEEDSVAQDRLNTILNVMCESMRMFAVVLFPVMPSTCERILSHLGCADNFSLEWGTIPPGTEIQEESVILFEKRFLNEDGTISTSAANFRPKKNPKAKK